MSIHHATKSALDLAAEEADVLALARELDGIPASIAHAHENLNSARVAELRERQAVIPRIIERRRIRDLESTAATNEAQAIEWDRIGREEALKIDALEKAAIEARTAADLNIAEVQGAFWRAVRSRETAREAAAAAKELRLYGCVLEAPPAGPLVFDVFVARTEAEATK